MDKNNKKIMWIVGAILLFLFSQGKKTGSNVSGQIAIMFLIPIIGVFLLFSKNYKTMGLIIVGLAVLLYVFGAGVSGFGWI